MKHVEALQKIKNGNPELRSLYARDLLAVCLGDAHLLLVLARKCAELCADSETIADIDEAGDVVADILGDDFEGEA